MVRTLFKHEFDKQKDFENLHASAVKTLSSISNLQKEANWHNGDIVPSNAIGKNGDFYLDKSNGNIHLKENGRWQ